MIEFNSYVRNPLAPRIFVNNLGALGAQLADLTLPYSNATASLSVVG
jgi:hypothetical protein